MKWRAANGARALFLTSDGSEEPLMDANVLSREGLRGGVSVVIRVFSELRFLGLLGAGGCGIMWE